MNRIILAIVVLLMAGNVYASGLTEKIQAKYDSMSGFQADFLQQLKNAASGEVETREGSISFQQPSLVRWETIAPEKELLVVGADLVWDYFADDGMVIKYSRDQILNSKTMIKFISGKAKLDEDFVVEEQGMEAGLHKLMLTPKEPEPSLVLAYAWVEPESFLLKSILLLDFYGNANKLGLDNIRLNPEFKAGLFNFTPPKGVEVQDNTGGMIQPALQ